MNPQTEIDILKLEKALAELDADWFRRQDSFKFHSRGRDYIPQTEDTNVGYGLLILAFISMMAFYWVSLIHLKNVVLGTVIILLFAVGVYQNGLKAKYYQEQKAIYDTQREHLLLRIQKLKSLV